MPVQKSFGKGR